jgi:hypothetical protein
VSVQRPDEPFSNDDLARWIRRHPEVWSPADVDVAREERSADELVDMVLARRGRRGVSRRRRLAVGAGLVAVVAGGAVGVAALLRSGQPTAVEAGILCRARAAVDADAFEIASGGDPVADCRQVWMSGQLSNDEGTIPELTACVGSGGTLDVFPGGLEVCETLGLVPLEPALSADNAAIVALQDRLVNEVNAVDCRPVQEVLLTVQDLVDTSGLAGWRVVAEPGTESGACAKAAVDSATRTVTVFDLSPPSPSSS